MSTQIIDVFCHVLPPVYSEAVRRVAKPPFMFDRATGIATMCNLDARFRLMDAFEGYRQIISLASPPIESLGHASRVRDLAKIANDAMAEWVARYPDRFAGFVASLPLHDLETSRSESDRACKELGALGVQLFSSVNSQPIDTQDTLQIIAHVALMDKAIWLHPVRVMARPDYPNEPMSKFDSWWAFGWPYETSLAMARLVFAGVLELLPDLVIVTHHAGGIVPMLEGRLAAGLDQLGTRTPPGSEWATDTCLKMRPVDAFRKFYADTASFGSKATIACGLDFFGIDRMMFASDMPFGPQHGEKNLRETLAAVDALHLTAEQKNAILSGNAERIFGLKGA
ncbi:MAG: amidohydrolase family protein [Candidatus Hydrogenedentes bacterium]|nr:amidohydrolase family protein [Candidatus Hydrogenedentota bacterium]